MGVEFRRILEENKIFLHKLYEGKEARTVLKGATIDQLNLLGAIFHKIVTAEIGIGKSQYTALKKKRKFSKLQNNFGPNFEAFLDLDDDAKISQLLNLKVVLPLLLHLIFNRKPQDA
jgi:hypothetical protein